MVNKLSELLHKRLLDSPQNPDAIFGLTIGVEHEFFLLDANGVPASHEQSQQFFLALSKCQGWHVQQEEDSVLGPMIVRVSRDNRNGRFTAIKYDHHPHLLEVALEYHDNLHDLHSDLEKTFKLMSDVAAREGLIISHSPFAPVAADDPKVISVLPDYCDLRHYRSKLFDARGEPSEMQLINYAAVVAATQVHIGGTAWWRFPRFVEELYLLEPDLVPYTHALDSSRSVLEVFEHRWTAYRRVFSGYPLIGFPKMTTWSLETWAKALMASPLAGGKGDHYAAQTSETFDALGELGFRQFMSAVRDLQIIRPKIFGTLEFRADPAQPNVDAILGIAALRLAMCIGVTLGHKTKRSLVEAHDLWWRGGSRTIDSTVLANARKWLSLRTRGEEKYLDYLNGEKKQKVS